MTGDRCEKKSSWDAIFIRIPDVQKPFYVYQLKDLFFDFSTISRLRQISSLAGEKPPRQNADMRAQSVSKLTAPYCLPKAE
jgi:hypothetical protein